MKTLMPVIALLSLVSLPLFAPLSASAREEGKKPVKRTTRVRKQAASCCTAGKCCPVCPTCCQQKTCNTGRCPKGCCNVKVCKPGAACCG